MTRKKRQKPTPTVASGDHESEVEEASRNQVGIVIDAAPDGWGYVLFHNAGLATYTVVAHDLGFETEDAARAALTKAMRKRR